MFSRSHRALGAAILVVAQLVASASLANNHCTAWLDQGNGTSWALCVDGNGVQHCWMINNTPGSVAYEVSCTN